ncbi:MAG: ATP-binding protein [Gemmataceae bacterium]|nr:ATP-binding protein [Gemmataceae bacterium]
MSFQQNSAELCRLWDFVALAAGKIAHDLSNILTGVNGFAELAASQATGQTLVLAYLDEVQQAGARGVALANRLHLLKHCANRQSFQAPVDFAVESAVSAVQASLPQSPSLQVQIAEPLPTVRISPDALRIVLIEIIKNACEAAGGAGEVRISAERKELSPSDINSLLGSAAAGRHVCITVQDSGPGFTSDLLSKLLTVPFFTTKPGSRGIGLPIVFRTLTAYQSAMSLGNRATGGGR